MSSAPTLLSDFMTRDVKTAKDDALVSSICKIMSENNIGSVIIVSNKDHGKHTPIGIITERDVVKSIASNHSSVNLPASKVMSKPLITIAPQATFLDAVETMQTRNIRRLPVIDGQKLVGIVTDKDILKQIMKDRSAAEVVLSRESIEQITISDQPIVYMLGDMLHRR